MAFRQNGVSRIALEGWLMEQDRDCSLGLVYLLCMHDFPFLSSVKNLSGLGNCSCPKSWRAHTNWIKYCLLILVLFNECNRNGLRHLGELPNTGLQLCCGAAAAAANSHFLKQVKEKTFPFSTWNILELLSSVYKLNR